METKTLKRVFWVLTCFLLISSARAEEAKDLTQMSLQDLMNIEITGASKFLQKASEAPASVSFVTADDIQRFGYRTLVDVLRSLPGFYATNDRNYSYIGVRGFARPGDYNSRLLLLVDGHRLNDNVFDSILAGYESPIDLDSIRQIEIIRGPSSSLYGTSAFFGVINIVTKTGADLKGAEVTAEASSQKAYRGRFAYGDKLQSGFEFSVSGSILDSRGHERLYFGEFDDPATNKGIAENADAERNRTFFTNFSYRNFSARTGYGSRKKFIPTAAFETVFNTGSTYSTDSRFFTDLKYDKLFRSGLQLTLRWMFDKYRYKGDYLYDYSETDDPQIVVNRDKVVSDTWGAEILLTQKLWNRHQVTVGSEYRNNLSQDQFNFDVDPYFPYLEDHRDSDVWALYAQDEFALHKDLILSAGLRHDHYRTFGGTTNPRLGLIYGAAKQTTLKALYGQAFRAPNNYELYYKSTTAKQNPLLQPESIKTFELITEHLIGQTFRIRGSAYEYRIRNLINQVSDPADEMTLYENSGRINARGVELELEGRDLHGVELRMSYALQRTIEATTSELMTNSPKHLARIGIFAPFAKGIFSAGLETFYMSKRRASSSEPAEGFVLANLTLYSRKLLRDLDMSLGIYNLFDKKYTDPVSQDHRQNVLEQDGRAFRVKLSYRIPIARFND